MLRKNALFITFVFIAYRALDSAHKLLGNGEAFQEKILLKLIGISGKFIDLLIIE